jgi:hypothetical protein
MSRSNRTQLIFGIILILLGAWFLAVRTMPDLQSLLGRFSEWPWQIIGAGIVLLVIGLVIGAPRMAIPACVVAGIGGILYYQNLSGDWASWSYMWTLIPGFVGVGNILAGILGGDFRRSFGHGLNLIITSAVLFLIFAAFFGGLDLLGAYGPAMLLILLGAWIVARGLIRTLRHSSGE